MQPAVVASVSQTATKKSSMVPLIAIAAVLLLIAGGAVWYSRQAPPSGSPTTAATPTEAPKSVPAMATQQAEPAASPAPAASAPAAQPPAPDLATRSASERAAIAAATKEAVTAKPAPTPAAAAAVKAGTAAAVTASRTNVAPAPGTSTAAPTAAVRDAQPAPAAPPAATISDNAAVMFRCSGAPDVCASLRSNVNDALDKAGFRVVTSPDRADIAIGAVAGGLQEKVSQQFGQTFATRTYQIELSGEAPKLGDAVSMPPATTVSFDASVGRERLEEKSRLVASDIVDRIRAYIKKKRG
jgi:hypothetical protein